MGTKIRRQKENQIIYSKKKNKCKKKNLTNFPFSPTFSYFSL